MFEIFYWPFAFNFAPTGVLKQWILSWLETDELMLSILCCLLYSFCWDIVRQVTFCLVPSWRQSTTSSLHASSSSKRTLSNLLSWPVSSSVTIQSVCCSYFSESQFVQHYSSSIGALWFRHQNMQIPVSAEQTVLPQLLWLIKYIMAIYKFVVHWLTLHLV